MLALLTRGTRAEAQTPRHRQVNMGVWAQRELLPTRRFPAQRWYFRARCALGDCGNASPRGVFSTLRAPERCKLPLPEYPLPLRSDWQGHGADRPNFGAGSRSAKSHEPCAHASSPDDARFGAGAPPGASSMFIPISRDCGSQAACEVGDRWRSARRRKSLALCSGASAPQRQSGASAKRSARKEPARARSRTRDRRLAHRTPRAWNSDPDVRCPSAHTRTRQCRAKGGAAAAGRSVGTCRQLTSRRRGELGRAVRAHERALTVVAVDCKDWNRAQVAHVGRGGGARLASKTTSKPRRRARAPWWR